MRIDLKKFRKKISSKIRNTLTKIGVLKRNISLFEAVALISSGTIGAGVLGIPYAVAQVGLPLGLIYIILIGLLVTGLHLLVGDVALRTKGNLQLVGLTKKFLGRKGGILMSLLLYTMLLGTLVVYIIGEGEVLTALFGGDSLIWSIIFFTIASLLVYFGLETLKKLELIMTGAIFSVVVLITGLSSPYFQPVNIQYFDLAKLFFPFGVLLFAFHGVAFIPEAQKLLQGEQKKFKQAIIISGILTIIAYALFALTIVGVTGEDTTKVATVGLGKVIGSHMVAIGNAFAAITMATSFMVIGVTIKDSLRTDYNLSNLIATFLACGLPLLVFLLGLRDFIVVTDMVGGVIISIEMIVLIFIYWKATQEGGVCPVKYKLHHSLLVVIVALIIFTLGSIYSIWNLF